MGLRTTIWRLCYEALAARVRTHDWSFMNYGYAEAPDGRDPVTLDPRDEPDRLSIQLYVHTLAGNDLSGADVLEVGCGRGGGSSYVSRTQGPTSMTGMDLSYAAVSLCRRARREPGLTFVQGDALAMPFPDATFDAVVNVESSHCYESMPGFLAEVHRVLRPGGSLFWADIRGTERAHELRREFAESPLTLRRSSDITAEVLHALELDNARRISLVERWIPWGFRRAMRRWAGIVGTTNVNRLAAGQMRYLSAWLVKEA